MSYAFPEGAQILFSTTFAAAKTITALNNANPAVATSTAHGYADASEILLTSGWEDATDTVFRTAAIDANSFGVKGLNTTNTGFYVGGAGIPASAQLVSAWTAIPQVLTIGTTGGDAKFTTISPLARRNDINVPVGFNAASTTLTLGHDPSNATFQTMIDISRSLTKCAFKLLLTGGGASYGYGYLNVSETPQLNKGQTNQVTAAFTFIGRTISY